MVVPRMFVLIMCKVRPGADRRFLFGKGGCSNLFARLYGMYICMDTQLTTLSKQRIHLFSKTL